MRLITRNRSHRNRRSKIPWIAISQAEITADLHYPASRQVAGRAAADRRRGDGR